MKTTKKWVMAIVLSATTLSPAMAATEIDESEFGPTYGTMMVDAFIGKPLGALAVAGGVIASIVSLPFTVNNDELDQVERKLILEPIAALDRCLGCTPAEDAYYRSQLPRDVNGNVVRVAVDGPSEVLINTNQNVVVHAP